MLYFTGFTVIEPFLVHAPVRIGDDERAAYLALYRNRVLCLASAPSITYPKLADYDAHFVLKSRRRSQIDGDGIALNPLRSSRSRRCPRADSKSL